MKLLIVIVSSLLLGFNFDQAIKSWESSGRTKDAQNINIRNGIIHHQPICLEQLKRGHFPLNCYHLVNSIQKLLPQQPLNKEVSKLNNLCKNYISELNSKREIDKLSRTLHPFNTCYEALIARKLILTYKNIYN